MICNDRVEPSTLRMRLNLFIDVLIQRMIRIQFDNSSNIMVNKKHTKLTTGKLTHFQQNVEF